MTPKSTGLAILVGTLVVMGGLVWFFRSNENSGRAGASSPAPAKTSPAPNAGRSAAATAQPPAAATPSVSSSGPDKTATAPRIQPPPALPADFPAHREGARQVLEHVQFTIRDFRLALGENPMGENVEITRALLGDNQKQVRFEMPSGSTVNGRGELCDPWGTPYFFHALSRDHMEVRSAGPDRKMWTDDDLLQ